VIRREYEIAVDNHTDRKAGPDRDGRLNVEVAADDLLAGLIEAVGAAAPSRWRCRYDAILAGGLAFHEAQAPLAQTTMKASGNGAAACRAEPGTISSCA
jgi:hypothetical protein